MNVSVIIPAFNAAATIQETLTALAVQDFNSPFEVIVVDDGSTDQTAAIVKQFSFVIYVHQANAGPASARNHGAHLAKGDLLCFTDSDCRPHPDWISQLVKGFLEDSIGAVCGSYGIANPSFVLARGIQAEIIFRHQYLLPDFPKVFGSYNVCIRKKVFKLAGGFNVQYRQASGEDNDLSYQVQKCGFRIYFQRKALVDHEHTVLVWKYLNEQYRHGFWRVRMYVNHPGMARGDHYTFWKDMIELPWGGAIIVMLIGILFNFHTFINYLLILMISLYLFELLFAWRMMRELLGGIFFAFVMMLRVLARLFGLSTGIVLFFSRKLIKKS